jgi:hypothetical protein
MLFFLTISKILDTNVLKTIRSQLTSLLENIEQTEFFKTIRMFTSERVDKFLNECDVRLLFPATRHRTLETLRTTPFSALAKVGKSVNLAAGSPSNVDVDLQKFIAVCDSALDLLTLEKKRLLAGTLKNQLSEWWLQLIKEAVEKFLKEEGYDLEAVPFNCKNQSSDQEEGKETYRSLRYRTCSEEHRSREKESHHTSKSASQPL